MAALFLCLGLVSTGWIYTFEYICCLACCHGKVYLTTAVEFCYYSISFNLRMVQNGPICDTQTQPVRVRLYFIVTSTIYFYLPGR